MPISQLNLNKQIMTRYDVFDKIEKLCELQKTGEHMYNKMIQSGQLAETHCDYNRGYYDVCIFYLFMNKKTLL